MPDKFIGTRKPGKNGTIKADFIARAGAVTALVRERLKLEAQAAPPKPIRSVADLTLGRVT